MAITQTQVSELYVAILGRASEGEGNEFWMAEDNTSTAATAMLASADAITYFGASLDTDQAFIEAIYLNTLGKTYAEDPGGIDFWVTNLATQDRGTVVAGLVDAANDPANAGDAQDMFQNKVAFSNYTAANVYTVDPADMSPFDISTITEDSSTLTDAILDVVVDAPVDGGDGGGGDEPVDEGTDDVVLLTADQDNISTGGGNDTILGYIFDNQNTAQSGDTIDGGNGNDSLYADIGNSQDFAITIHTESVETFSVRAQTQDGTQDEGENNMNDVQIDAERMNGTDRYESDNSRADVTIEDVRIEDDQITQDITVAMVQTDPGNVDFGLYFDQHSLRNAADVESGAVLGLNLMDIESNANGLDPLHNNPYDQITFSLDGVSYTLELQNIIDVKTYADFEAAVSLAVSLTPGLEDVTVERLGNTFDAIYTDTGITYTGETISLVNNGDGDFEIGSWNASGGIPAAGEYLLDQVPGTGVVSSSLITSTIILDDVGRGSMGGDLVIGGLSTGITSDSTGVEQFNITVERSSELQEINSTNNTLQEVYIVNGENKGNLVVAGDTNGDNDLPGAQGDAGFTDVRVIDASAMVGTVSIDAELTDAVAGKYMNTVDNAGNINADDIIFNYDLGTNNDNLNLAISNSNLAIAGATAREDFDLAISGNAGNDTITTIIGDGAGNDGTAWYDNSVINANLSVDGGVGNDTITTTGTGNFSIDAGAGNDTVYADNSGTKGSWAINASAASTALESANAAAAAVTDGLLAAEAITNTVEVAATVGAAVTAAKVITAASTYTAPEIAAMDLALDNAVVAGASQTDIYNTLIAATDSAKSNGSLLVSDTDTITGTPDALLYGATLTVTYAGDAANSVIGGVANAYTEGYESSVTIDTNGNLGNEMSIVQAIKKAINDDAVLSQLLTATDGTGNTLSITNDIDGLTAATDLSFSIVAANPNGTTDGLVSGATNELGATNILTSAELSSLKAEWNDMLNTSGAVITDAAMYTQLNTSAGNALTAVTQDVITIGNESTSTGDNVITMGAGDDVIVLGTNDALLESNDTILFSGYNQGNDTIVNFLEAGTNADSIDLSAYLSDGSLNKTSVSGSIDSQVQIAQVVSTAAVTAADNIAANEIVIQTGLTFTAAQQTAGQSWDNMTAANFSAAINNASATAYGNIANTIDADAGVVVDFVGTTQTSIVFVENDLNDGEYKIFELSQDNTASLEFTDVQLIGTVDFGDSITVAATFV